MKFIEKIKEELAQKDERVKRINEKIEENIKRIKSNEDNIRKLEVDFQKTFNEKSIGEISDIKEEISKLNKSNDILKDLIRKENNIIIDPDSDVIKEFEMRAKELNLNKLRDNILNAQKNYLKTFDEYKEALIKYSEEIKELGNSKNHISDEIKHEIIFWGDKKVQELHPNVDYNSANIENDLIWHVRCSVNGISSIELRRFFK